MQIAADDDSVLTKGFDSENMSLALNLTAAARASRLFGAAAKVPIQGASPPMDVLSALSTLPLTLNNHVQGVTPADFQSSKLPDAFTVLATNKDRKGRPFVAAVEGRKGLPVWATQFHPEKNIFEQGFTDAGAPFEHIPHDIAAVQASQFMANFFVAAARSSTHRYTSADEEWSRLVYRRTTSTTMKPAFLQVYVFSDNATDAAAADSGMGDDPVVLESRGA